MTDTPVRPLLWRHLWNWTFGAVLAVWVTLVAVAVSTGFHEARKFIDGQLVAIAHVVLSSGPGAQTTGALPTPPPWIDLEFVQHVAVLSWVDGRLQADTHRMAAGLDLSVLAEPGLRTVVFNDRQGQHDWRVYVAEHPQAEGVRRVAVLLDQRERNALGWDIAEHVTQPALLLLPLVAGVLWWAIRRGLRPLEQLSREVAGLDRNAQQRLDTARRHREFVSTVTAINTLVDSLQAQARREREFASDVAHELRTPLAALALQASAAQHDHAPERLAELEQSALRAGRILAQLLDLARAQRKSGAAGESTALAPVDLGEVAAAVVAEHVPLGDASGHELSLFQPQAPVQVPVPRMLLELALRNLIANALRHTPGGTQVVVQIWQTAEASGVSVVDDGQRFGANAMDASAPRPASDGLGLGLRLVERMAEQMGAHLEREVPEPPMTTRFTLRWPR